MRLAILQRVENAMAKNLDKTMKNLEESLRKRLGPVHEYFICMKKKSIEFNKQNSLNFYASSVL